MHPTGRPFNQPAPDHEQAERIDFDAARHTANVWARGYDADLVAEKNLARAYLALAAQLAEQARENERLDLSDVIVAMQHRNRNAVHDIGGVIASISAAQTLMERDGRAVTGRQLEHWLMCLRLTRETMQK